MSRFDGPRRGGWIVPVLAALVAPVTLSAQARAAAPPAFAPLEVSADGVLRRSDDQAEVALFGVNYTVPFAYAYRALGYVGADRKAAIDMDVAHLSRLGVQAYRIHVWDREVSDRAGHLLQNDHLDLLDYLIERLERRGIRVLLTPIAWWGTGYPEPDPPTEGFAEGHSKGDMTVDTVLRRAERTYIREFVTHVNRYTGLSYRDDPAVVAIELFNEPVHPGGSAETTRFIDDLAAAARSEGWTKPVFYNVAEGWTPEHARAVCAAAIQGVTFQWYPTGLVRGSAIGGNMLPNVDRYPIPFDSSPGCLPKARIVYEFDAADVMGSYMYPAMARSFRTAGMQWATQFAYDPAAIAAGNSEYQTHYLNLLYTPRKALSFLIAGEAFRRLPRGGSYGAYPASARFGPFRVSYEEDLSEMNDPESFYYSNATRTRPSDPRRLRRVAGYGSSPLVEYDGMGAYFLDRLEAGVWRLEVYPDAVPLRDPFGRNRVDDEVTRLVWRERPMRLRLPDLGDAFSVRAVDRRHALSATASAGRFRVRPGVYVLRRAGVDGQKWRDPAADAGGRPLGEFMVPAPRPNATSVVRQPAPSVPVARRPARVVLFDAARDRSRMLLPHWSAYVPYKLEWVTAEGTSGGALRVDVQTLEPPPHEVALRSFLDEESHSPLAGSNGFATLVVRARSVREAADTLQVALVERDGTAWGAALPLTSGWENVSVPLRSLRRVPLRLLPRGYPLFLPIAFASAAAGTSVHPATLDGVQLVLRAEEDGPPGWKRGHTFEIERIQIER